MHNKILRVKKSEPGSIAEMFRDFMSQDKLRLIILSEKAVLQNVQALSAEEFFFIVIDEGHSIKNYKSKYSLFIIPGSPNLSNNFVAGTSSCSAALRSRITFLSYGVSSITSCLAIWALSRHLRPITRNSSSKIYSKSMQRAFSSQNSKVIYILYL